MVKLAAMTIVTRPVGRVFACSFAAFACVACVSSSDKQHPSQPALRYQAESPLRGTYWKLVRLGDMPVHVAENQREPHLILANFEPRVSGSGGCNRVTGSFDLDGDKLHLRSMAGTRMACVAGMEQEQRFLQTIEMVDRYRIKSSHLELLDAGGVVIARFEAVALR